MDLVQCIAGRLDQIVDFLGGEMLAVTRVGRYRDYQEGGTSQLSSVSIDHPCRQRVLVKKYLHRDVALAHRIVLV